MATKGRMVKTPVVAIYARVSTKDQDCDMQLTELRSYVTRMGWPAAVEYVETASGKAASKRPVLEKLLAAARLRHFDTVLVWKLDRFGRSMTHVVGNVQQLSDCGVRFMAPSQGIDTDNKSPMGKFVIGMFALFAELERDLIVERVNCGQMQYRADYAAGRIGTTKASKSGKNLPAHRPRRIFHRGRAFEMRKAGASLRSIAKALGVPLSTIADALKSSKP